MELDRKQLETVLETVYVFENISVFTFDELGDIYHNSSDFKKRIMGKTIAKILVNEMEKK